MGPRESTAVGACTARASSIAAALPMAPARRPVMRLRRRPLVVGVALGIAILGGLAARPAGAAAPGANVDLRPASGGPNDTFEVVYTSNLECDPGAPIDVTWDGGSLAQAFTGASSSVCSADIPGLAPPPGASAGTHTVTVSASQVGNSLATSIYTIIGNPSTPAPPPVVTSPPIGSPPSPPSPTAAAAPPPPASPGVTAIVTTPAVPSDAPTAVPVPIAVVPAQATPEAETSTPEPVQGTMSPGGCAGGVPGTAPCSGIGVVRDSGPVARTPGPAPASTLSTVSDSHNQAAVGASAGVAVILVLGVLFFAWRQGGRHRAGRGGPG